MKRIARFSVAVVTAALAVTAVAGPLVGPASAAPAAKAGALPADPAAKGFIGLCNENGQNVTGGSVATAPFIWKAVASVPPPSGYQGKGQSAVLGIVQPRPGTAAVDWNGTPLTAASYYRQKSAPATQSTYADRSLSSVIRQFPPQVDGLYVLRMYFGRAGYGNYNATYPTTTIQVTGSSWRVVQGGTVDCHRSTAVSNEQLTGVAGARQTTARKPSSSQRTVDTARTRTISVPAAAVRSAAAGSSTGASGTGTAATAAADTSRSSSSAWLLWTLAGLVVLLVIALIVTRSGALARSRRTGPPRS